MSKPLIIFLLIVIVYLSTLPTTPVHETIFNTVDNEPEATVYESLTISDGYYFYIETHYPYYTRTEVGWWNYMDIKMAMMAMTRLFL